MNLDPPEFSQILRAHEIGTLPRRLTLAADADARCRLQHRFGLLSLDTLCATLELRREARGIKVTGQVQGTGTQPCVTSGEPVPFLVNERVALLLVGDAPAGGDIELSTPDLDIEPNAGDEIDVGELAAQAFALGLDPYPRSSISVPGVLSEQEAAAMLSPFSVLKKI